MTVGDNLADTRGET